MSRLSVLRQLNWSQLDAAQRSALVDRDLNKVITTELREQISALVLDVRNAAMPQYVMHSPSLTRFQ